MEEDRGEVERGEGGVDEEKKERCGEMAMSWRSSRMGGGNVMNEMAAVG